MHSRFARCISKPSTSLEKGGVVCLDTVSDLPSCPQVKFFPSESSWGGAGWNSLWQKIVLSLLLPWVNREGLLCFHPLLPLLWHPVCLRGWCLPSAVLTRVGNLPPFLPAFYFCSLLEWALGIKQDPCPFPSVFLCRLDPQCVLTPLLYFPDVSMWHSWGAQGWGGGPGSLCYMVQVQQLHLRAKWGAADAQAEGRDDSSPQGCADSASWQQWRAVNAVNESSVDAEDRLESELRWCLGLLCE